MKADQERVKNLLIDTVTLLCKNSLTYQDELCIEGLLGVKVDQKDVFFVHISQTFQNEVPRSSAPDEVVPSNSKSQEVSSHPTGERVRIKREAGPHEHSPRRDPGTVVGAHRAEMVAGQRRAPHLQHPNNHHQSPLPTRSSSTSPRGGAPDLQQVSGRSPPTDSGDGLMAENHQDGFFGEPPIKRRLKSESYMGEEDALNDSVVDETNAWPHLMGSIGGTNLAAHIAQSTLRDFENSHQGPLDGAQPGSSTWPFTAGMLQQATADMTGSVLKGAAGGGWMTPGGRGAGPSRGKDFPCEVCGKVFHMGHHLRQHLRIHTGERPYRCANCGSTFTQISSLNRHQKAQHTCSAAKAAAAATSVGNALQAGLVELPENILSLAKDNEGFATAEDTGNLETQETTSPQRHNMTSEASLMTTNPTTSPPGSAQYMCTDCNIEFKQYDRFLEHVKNAHTVS